MSAKYHPEKIASVEDVDEYSGNIIEGSSRYAASHYASSAVASPTKEKPNTGRTRNKRRDSTSPLTDSDSTVHPQGDLLKRSTRDREKAAAKKAMIPSSHSRELRPSPRHSRTAPVPKRDRDLEASYYGVSPILTPASTRPRQNPNARPASYYDNRRPPQSNTNFYARQPPMQTPTSFPPPSWAASSPAPYPPPSPGPGMGHPPPDYFSRPLGDRFAPGPANRPQSSIGFRPPPKTVILDEYDDEPVRETSIARRPSEHRRMSKIEDDRRQMPPPPSIRRAATTRPTQLAFRPPPGTPARRAVPYDEDELFHVSPHAPQDYSSPIPVRSRSRRPSIGATSITYDAGDIQTEIAGRHARRHSYYGNGNKTSSSGSGYEDKVRQATIYQEETGGPALPLTAETLRKAGRNGGSSRSTRSSASRDESDYRQSATTRTTRSSNDNEDVTIRVKGGGIALKVGGAEMRCKEGAEINIISRNTPSNNYRSDKSSYMGYDDRERLPRIERPPTRNRSSSQAGSYPRSLPKYEQPPLAPLSYAPYYPHPQEIPPYPSYPHQDEWV